MDEKNNILHILQKTILLLGKKSIKKIEKSTNIDALQKYIIQFQKNHKTEDTPKKIDKNNNFGVDNIKNTKAFKELNKLDSQIQYYTRMHTCTEILKLVELDSKRFGSQSEKIIKELLNLGPRTSVQNDATRKNKKIEIKTARYWSGKNDCKWQHLEPEYDYDYVIFALLDFTGWKVWIINKQKLWQLKDKKIITFQGKQGWWVKKSAIEPFLNPFNNILELDKLLEEL
jgi:hypothetical protein